MIDIGSHTLTHTKLTTLNDIEIYQELSESKKQIEDKIKDEVKFLAYPYGSKNEVNDKIIKMAEEIGYEMAFSTKRPFEQVNAFFDVPRYNIDNNIQKKDYYLKLMVLKIIYLILRNIFFNNYFFFCISLKFKGKFLTIYNNHAKQNEIAIFGL